MHQRPFEHGEAVVDYDTELQRYTELFRQACGIQRHEHVLDVGCGIGQTTRDAARLAAAGSALGVDISAQVIERARALARAEGLRNIAFEHADAQVHPFPNSRFDVAISQFGTMFFADPRAAFANIGRALRPAGRLVMLVWQAHERNAWSVSIQRALAGRAGWRPPAPTADPFSLADRPTVAAILGAAGFGQVTFTEVAEPVFYGPHVPAALDWVRGFVSTRAALADLEPAAAEHALQRLRDMLAAQLSEQGVWFDARAWIVAARRQ